MSYIPSIAMRGGSYRSPVLQRVLNHFPEWAKARNDKHSNMAAVLSPWSAYLQSREEVVNYVRNCTQSIHGDVHALSEFTTWPIDTSFAFNFVDYLDYVDYEAPAKVTGVSGVNSFTLEEAHNRNAEYALVAPPISFAATLTTEVPLANLTGTGITLEDSEFCLECDTYIHGKVEATSLGYGLNHAGLFYLPQLQLVNVDNEEDVHTISIVGPGYYRFPLIVRAGVWRVQSFAMHEIDYTLFIGDFNKAYAQERAYRFPTMPETFSFGYSFLADDASYLQFVTHAPGGVSGALLALEENMALESVALLDTGGTPVTGLDLVKQEYGPYVYVLDDSDRIHVYDTNLDTPAYLYDNTREYMLELMHDDLDWRVGDEICISTVRKAIFMSEEFNSLTMKVLHTDHITNVEREYYIDTSGNEVDEGAAAVGVYSNIQSWRNVRWGYTLPTWGSYKFVLQAVKTRPQVGSTLGDPMVASELIIHCQAKAALATVNLHDTVVGLDVLRTGVGLRYGTCGLQLLDDASGVWDLAPVSGQYFIDYENYLLYTPQDWDSVTVIT